MPRESSRRKGRAKGALNTSTASAKGAFALAFDQIGGAQALGKWAAENQTEFYKLYARLIPSEVTGKDGAPLNDGERYYVILGGQKVPF